VSNHQHPQYNVAVVGAGPSGLFAARELAENGVHVVLFNRDIKPGGLAEYGIYPTKQRMKDGLRNQFRQVLANPGVDYFGNLVIGEEADLRLEQLRELGFHAILITVGAQSTKWLGIPGEDLTGVYHAKDIVYHYNLLPPYSESTYQIGKRIAVVGAGNVMMDITHWLVEDKQVEEVISIARRGPAEVKFDKKELEILVNYIDQLALNNELNRVTPLMRSIGQDPDLFRKTIADVAVKGFPALSKTRFLLQFLMSPVRILGDSSGRVTGLELEDNTLVLGEDGGTRARGTGVRHVLDVDTVIFAIGDLVDSGVGLAVQGGEYVKTPFPRYPMDGASYEAFDPDSRAHDP
jgi:ferredoxin/flavodoxin---NADP+ reductase